MIVTFYEYSIVNSRPTGKTIEAESDVAVNDEDVILPPFTTTKAPPADTETDVAVFDPGSREWILAPRESVPDALTAKQKEDLLRALFPDCEFALRGGEISSWRGPWDRPTDEDLVANANRVEAFRLEKEKEKRKAYLADARWKAETGGLTLPNGISVKTDRESQSLLTGASFSATMDPETSIEWKGANGWVVLTSQQVLQIAGLVRQHVQGCFTRERVLGGLVDEATTIEEVLAVEW